MYNNIFVGKPFGDYMSIMVSLHITLHIMLRDLTKSNDAYIHTLNFFINNNYLSDFGVMDLFQSAIKNNDVNAVNMMLNNQILSKEIPDKKFLTLLSKENNYVWNVQVSNLVYACQYDYADIVNILLYKCGGKFVDSNDINDTFT
jgi:hypothetical protein